MLKTLVKTTMKMQTLNIDTMYNSNRKWRFKFFMYCVSLHRGKSHDNQIEQYTDEVTKMKNCIFVTKNCVLLQKW